MPHAPSWPYELLIYPRDHVADLPAAGPRLRQGLAAILVDVLTRPNSSSAPTPRTCSGPTSARTTRAAITPPPTSIAPGARAAGPGSTRHLASAELGAGVFFDPVDPRQAAARWRSA